MSGSELLLDAFGRVQAIVHDVGDGIDGNALRARLDPEANTIGWLIWHLTRIQDDHVAQIAGTEQVYVSGGWWDALGRPFDVTDHGYGQTAEQVGSLDFPDVTTLLDYHDAVHEQTLRYLEGLTDDDFNRIVDTAWDPPVTLGMRLISVVGDCFEHAGQAAFVKGCLSRRQQQEES